MKNLSAALVLFMAVFVLGGCGNDTSGSGSGSVVAKSNGCITGGCHEIIASKVTGNAIGAEWQASSHKTMNVAGCTTCHGHSHQNSCSGCHGGAQVQNSQQNALDAGARCLDCHVSGPELMKGLDYRHIPELSSMYRQYSTPRFMSNYSSAGYYTMRGTPYESKCIWCHNPHDNRVLPQHRDWAESGHGDTNAGPFARASTDFKTRGSSMEWSQTAGDVCVRCHTSSGYINLVTSNMKNVSPWGLKADGKTPISFTRQVIYCNVCHDNGQGKAYGYNFRPIPAQGAAGGVRIYLNYSSSVSMPPTNNAIVENATERFTRIRIRNNAVDFPQVGISDRCILCHSGRGSGSLIKMVAKARGFNNQSAANFRKINKVSLHDFPGAGTMFRALGFEFYSSYRYAQPAGTPYQHDLIGRNDFAGTGYRGPCVSCHMSSSVTHSFLPVTEVNGKITSINTFLCNTCHASGGAGNAQFDGTAKGLNAKKTGAAAAVKALTAWLTKKRITSSTNWLRTATYPADLTAGGFNQTACTPAPDRSLDLYLGPRNMGASLNRDLVINDPGSFVHNDLYIKRLIYDSLDWVDNCTMDNSANLAINAATDTTLFGASALSLAERDSANAYLFTNNIGRPGDN